MKLTSAQRRALEHLAATGALSVTFWGNRPMSMPLEIRRIETLLALKNRNLVQEIEQSGWPHRSNYVITQEGKLMLLTNEGKLETD